VHILVAGVMRGANYVAIAINILLVRFWGSILDTLLNGYLLRSLQLFKERMINTLSLVSHKLTDCPAHMDINWLLLSSLAFFRIEVVNALLSITG
jgi:hypothetical protein